MKRRTIKSLMSNKRVVYIKLSTKQTAEAFFALAKYEGFVLNDDVAKTGVHRNCYIRLNEDMTVSYPNYHSWAGAMNFHHSKIEDGKKVVKIDFEKML